MDRTIADGDRVGDHERDYSGKTRRHGVNIQADTDPRRRAHLVLTRTARPHRRQHRRPHPPHRHHL
ncbi:hypothetical protein [Streptomyces sp. NPDC047981]|uniref:hypothetical protein n=1 Tax=Streptomyces sp. NPDC047981 TaxID=3154610 RepID=UPI00343A201A